MGKLVDDNWYIDRLLEDCARVAGRCQDSDLELAARIKDGDESAKEVLVARYAWYFVKCLAVRSRYAKATTACDAACEAMKAALSATRRYDGSVKFHTWARRPVRWHLLQMSMKEGRRSMPCVEFDPDEHGGACDPGVALDLGCQTALGAICGHVEAGRARAAALLAYGVLGREFSDRDVALLLGCSANTVRRLRLSALEQLRRGLKL